MELKRQSEDLQLIRAQLTEVIIEEVKRWHATGFHKHANMVKEVAEQFVYLKSLFAAHIYLTLTYGFTRRIRRNSAAKC